MIDFIFNVFFLNNFIFNNDIKMFYSIGMIIFISFFVNILMLDIFEIFIIVVVVLLVLVVIILVVLGIILWRKKRYGILIIF